MSIQSWGSDTAIKGSCFWDQRILNLNPPIFTNLICPWVNNLFISLLFSFHQKKIEWIILHRPVVLHEMINMKETQRLCWAWEWRASLDKMMKMPPWRWTLESDLKESNAEFQDLAEQHYKQKEEPVKNHLQSRENASVVGALKKEEDEISEVSWRQCRAL